jgi:hypothetical protein
MEKSTAKVYFDWLKGNINFLMDLNILENLGMTKLMAKAFLFGWLIVYFRKDGNNYIGEFLNNMKDGYGAFYYNDGSKYEG